MKSAQFKKGGFYKLTNKGIDNRSLFNDKEDYDRFIKLLYSCNSSLPAHLSNHKDKNLHEIPRGKLLIALGAWSIIPGKFYLIAKEMQTGGISLFMQKLQTGYTMYFNKKHKRKGPLFEGKFETVYLESDSKLKHAFSHVHLSPIEIVKKNWEEIDISSAAYKNLIHDYVYSSYFDYCDRESEFSVLISKKEFPRFFFSHANFEILVDDLERHTEK